MDDAARFNLSRYKHWTEDHVRFSDLDALGHVNNNSISQYFENARASLFQEVTPKWPHRDQIFILANTSIDFRRELHYPAKLKIGTAVLRIGTTSMSLCNALYRGNDGLAYCESVSVLIENATRKPIPIPDDIKKALQRYMV